MVWNHAAVQKQYQTNLEVTIHMISAVVWHCLGVCFINQGWLKKSRVDITHESLRIPKESGSGVHFWLCLPCSEHTHHFKSLMGCPTVNSVRSRTGKIKMPQNGSKWFICPVYPPNLDQFWNVHPVSFQRQVLHARFSTTQRWFRP